MSVSRYSLTPAGCQWSHGILRRLFCTVFLLGCGLLPWNPWLEGATAGETREAAANGWAFLTGYGTSHPGMGKTRIRAETIDFVARYEAVLIEKIGSSWYQGDHSLLLELPFHLLVNPKVAPMVGANFLACWTFTAAGRLRPYIFAGGGPLYMATDLQGMGTRLNGNYQFGGGLRYWTGGRFLHFEYRFHHVSNGGRKEPNDPLNSSKFLVGMAF